MAIEIRQATEDEWQTLRRVRLDALLDAPYAFGSTYERDAAFDEATWRSRLSNPENPTFFALIDGEVVGMDGVWTNDGETNLVAMWVAPRARRAGVAAALTHAVIDWAAARGVRQVVLGVAQNNDAARRLYEKLGFTFTGEAEPLMSDPSQLVLEMKIEIQPAP